MPPKLDDIKTYISLTIMETLKQNSPISYNALEKYLKGYYTNLDDI